MRSRTLDKGNTPQTAVRHEKQIAGDRDSPTARHRQATILLVPSVGSNRQNEMVRTSTPSSECLAADGEFLLDDRIALAHRKLQTPTIKHLDVAAAVADESAFLKMACRLRHSFPTDTGYVGDQLLRHGQRLTVEAIEA